MNVIFYQLSAKLKMTISKGETPLCNATVFNGFPQPLKCKFYRMKISITETRVQRCITYIPILKILNFDIFKRTSHRKLWSHSGYTLNSIKTCLGGHLELNESVNCFTHILLIKISYLASCPQLCNLVIL